MASPSLGFAIIATATDTAVSLRWGPKPGASGYLVYRDGAAAPLDPTRTTATEYLDFGLTNGHRYRYVVAALDSSGGEVGRTAAVEAVPTAAP